MNGSPSTRTIVLSVAAALVLTAASLLGVALLMPAGPFSLPGSPVQGTACSAPSFAGPTVKVTLSDMGSMLGGPRMRGGMRLSSDRASVPSGKVSFAVTNAGSVPHELVILPLPAGQVPGTRSVGADGRVDETGSVGEASASCAEGAGEGILPGASSWVTVELKPGTYELVCNLPGHYWAGMHTVLTAR
ncbi:sulfocyanin-like copper-binding protein [Sinomonas sp. ASV486]|uniref:Sulfocyanin-like copper-binding protein n=1 Tax=Sinomonas puerhi TaxID=3238584 RepID=A0AB39L2D8_9MICC|nr:sulfocyanin-like copper-binding protein [Sinomonas sp. ASV486]MDQ4489205.1 sulfocyanin-like copper-binding protein [Sinomonas sp. ASV486]